MKNLDKAELAASVRHFEIFSKSGIPIYNSEVMHFVVRITQTEKSGLLIQSVAMDWKVQHLVYRN